MAGSLVVEFDAAVQSLAALQAAAYRLIGTAACQIESRDGRYVCSLTLSDASSADDTKALEVIRLQFLGIVTDENLRERLAVKTEPMRNLILALAFGSLAAQPTRDPQSP